MKIHLLLRIGVWVAVLGIGYLVFGPGLFDSADSNNPFHNRSQLYLPPPKPARLIEYEHRMGGNKLGPTERAEYQSLAREWKARFWKGEDVTVEEALSGVKDHRGERLAAILKERGLSRNEISVFFMMVQRDRPSLLEDRE